MKGGRYRIDRFVIHFKQSILFRLCWIEMKQWRNETLKLHKIKTLYIVNFFLQVKQIKHKIKRMYVKLATVFQYTLKSAKRMLPEK